MIVTNRFDDNSILSSTQKPCSNYNGMVITRKIFNVEVPGE